MESYYVELEDGTVDVYEANNMKEVIDQLREQGVDKYAIYDEEEYKKL